MNTIDDSDTSENSDVTILRRLHQFELSFHAWPTEDLVHEILDPELDQNWSLTSYPLQTRQTDYQGHL
jgi:hypothetical protein